MAQAILFGRSEGVKIWKDGSTELSNKAAANATVSYTVPSNVRVKSVAVKSTNKGSSAGSQPWTQPVIKLNGAIIKTGEKVTGPGGQTATVTSTTDYVWDNYLTDGTLEFIGQSNAFGWTDGSTITAIIYYQTK